MSERQFYHLLFQFLIGRLKLKNMQKDQWTKVAFQFLIGRLKQKIYCKTRRCFSEFQFLIGRLKHNDTVTSVYKIGDVSIPYR